MFSIFHGLFTLFALTTDNINKIIYNAKSKEKAQKNKKLFYLGYKGNKYLVDNDRWVYVKRNAKGEDVITDVKTGNSIYNLTDIKKKNEEAEYLKNGKTVRTKMLNERNQTYYGKYRQMYYLVDIKTQTPVSTVFINGIEFYINLDSALLMRPTDESDINKIIGNWSYKDIIKIINKRQNYILSNINLNDQNKINELLFFKNHNIYIDNNKNINIVFNRNIKSIQDLYKKDGYKYNRENNRWE